MNDVPQEQHERHEEPFWQVLSIFDEDGGGGDFAYTVGLAERGLPELHIWARPTDGDDPGFDWAFSQRDRCLLLNELARLLLLGRLAPGTELVRHYDDGTATITLRIGAPVAPHDVDAFRVAEGAGVLPVRWSLQRPPEGTAQELSPTAASWAGAEFARLTSSLRGAAVLPAGWPRPARPLDFSPGQRFGPLTPLVLARTASVLGASVDDLATFLFRLTDGWHATGMINTLALPAAAARPAGRREAYDACCVAAEEVIRAVVGADCSARRWRDVLAICGAPLDADERKDLRTGLSGVLLDGVAVLLTTQTVADVAPHQTLLLGFGPWLAATASVGVTPGPEWHASPAVLSVVRDQVGPLDQVGLGYLVASFRLAELADRHATSQPHPYATLLSRLTGIACTSASASPAPAELLAGTPAGAVLARIPQWAGDVAHWMSCLTALLSARAEFDAQQVDMFAKAVRLTLPDLADALNAPLVVA